MRVENYIEPSSQIPLFAPAFLEIERYELAYPEKIRNWWRAVGDYKCQTFIYSEGGGWQICGSTERIEIDHLEEESVQLENGKDPNNSMGIPRCHKHHCGAGLAREEDGSLRIANYGEQDWSRHPDMGKALEDYRLGDKEAFKKAAKHHHELARQGKSVSNITPEIAQFEREHMEKLEQEYIKHTGQQRPSVSTHPKFIPKKKWGLL